MINVVLLLNRRSLQTALHLCVKFKLFIVCELRFLCFIEDVFMEPQIFVLCNRLKVLICCFSPFLGLPGDLRVSTCNIQASFQLINYSSTRVLKYNSVGDHWVRTPFIWQPRLFIEWRAGFWFACILSLGLDFAITTFLTRCVQTP